MRQDRCPHAWAQVLLLMALVVQTPPAARALAQGEDIVSGALYYFQHQGGRASCAAEADFMGYYNKTCSAGTTGAAYGPTVGPALRGEQSERWEQWNVTVVGQSPEGDDLVTIKTSYPAGRGQPLCQGFMSAEKQNACAADIWASRVHIHRAQKYVWRVARVQGDDSFNLIAESRSAKCLRYLGGAPTCSDRYLRLYSADDGTGHQRWLMSRVDLENVDDAGSPTPSPSLAPPPPQIPPPAGGPPLATPALPPAVAPAPTPAQSGPPSLTVTAPASTTVNFTISPASLGTPAMSYTLTFTQTSPPFASVILALAPGVLEGRATGLIPYTFYNATVTGVLVGGSTTPPSLVVSFATVAKPPAPCPPSTTSGCISSTCTSPTTSTCVACNTAVNYQSAPVAGKCQCAPTYTDLNGLSADGCEFQSVPLGTAPTFFTHCDYDSGCPGTWTASNYDTRTCASPLSGWAPFAVPPGTYAVSPQTADMSSMVVPTGYTVTLYQGGTLVNGVVTGATSSDSFTQSVDCFVNPCLGCPDYNDRVSFIKVV